MPETYDVNEGSMVLFRRGMEAGGKAYGEWEVGFVTQTFFTDGLTGPIVEPSPDRPNQRAWVEIAPAAEEGPSAPTTLSVLLDAEHIDPIRHGSEMPRG